MNYYEHIPVTDSDRHNLVATRPRAVEFFLFASYMLRRMEELESNWRDFQIGYVSDFGARVEKDELAKVVGRLLAELGERVNSSTTIFERRHQELAFGLPGQAGDLVMVQHLATRMVDGYGAILKWAEGARSLSFPWGSRRLRELLSEAASQPLQQYRDFVFEYARMIDDLPRRLDDPSEQPVNIDVTLTLSLPPDIIDRIFQEVGLIVRDDGSVL